MPNFHCALFIHAEGCFSRKNRTLVQNIFNSNPGLLHQNTKRTSQDVSKFCWLCIPGRTKTRKLTGKELFIIKWLRKNRDKSLPATFFIGYFYRIQLNYQWKWDIFFQCHFWRYFRSSRTKDEYSSILGVPSRRFFINFDKCPDSHGPISDSHEIKEKNKQFVETRAT